MLPSASREPSEKPPNSETVPSTAELLVCVVASEADPLSGCDAMQACQNSGIAARLLTFEQEPIVSELSTGSHELMFLLETGTYFPQRVEQVRKLRRAPGSIAGVLVGLHRNEATSWDYASGFDDFILRPYRDTELLARVQALLWRKHGSNEEVVTVGRLTLDVSAHRVTVDNQEITLTAKEFAILVSLTTNKGALVTRERILLESWHELSKVNPRMLDAHVSHLRHKLRGVVQLKTIRGKGYKLELHSTAASTSEAPNTPIASPS